MDSTSIRMLSQVIKNLESQNMRFYLSNLIGPVRDALEIYQLCSDSEEQRIFPTVHDAVLYFDEGVHSRSEIALQTNV